MIHFVDVNSFYTVPVGQSIVSVAQKMQLPCEVIFVAAIVKDIKKNIPVDEREEIRNLAKTACLTENPDIIWQIFKVETNFRVNIINIAGEKTLVGRSARKYIEKNLKKNDNVDIGPLQINWRANGSHYAFQPSRYFEGTFSVRFLSDYLLKDYVRSCQLDWINCYHSYQKKRGGDYRAKINHTWFALQKALYELSRV